MRFTVLLKGEPEVPPRAELARYLADLARAGVLLAAEAFEPSEVGARIRFADGDRTVIDGPFGEGSDLVAGFLLLDVPSRAAAVEWASRCPVGVLERRDGSAVVEVRGVAEIHGVVEAR